MFLSLITAVALAAPIQDQSVDLVRTFKAGQKATYVFTSRMQFEHRQVPLETFIPEIATYSSTINTTVEKMKPDGVADIRVKRPDIAVKTGETFDTPPKTIVLIKDVNQLITMSKKNQVLDFEDFTPKPKPPAGAGGGGGGGNLLATIGVVQPNAQDPIVAWMEQLRQLAAFVNFFDMGPILPSGPVTVGETWKETVGYAPVTVSEGADKGKNINARIDYAMTYMGKVARNGKNFHHIVGKMLQDTDAAPYLADLMGVKPEASIFKSVKLKLDGKVDYYLDLATLDPVEILANSTGSIDVEVASYTGGPVYQERFKSRASLVRK
jgi:hypothetical protein